MTSATSSEMNSPAGAQLELDAAEKCAAARETAEAHLPFVPVAAKVLEEARGVDGQLRQLPHALHKFHLCGAAAEDTEDKLRFAACRLILLARIGCG